MNNKRLTEAQITAIQYMSLPKKGGMTYEDIAEKVGVDVRTIYRWKNDDAFYGALKDKIVRDTADRLPEVMQAIPDIIIREGNAAMFRTFAQMHGLLADKVEVKTGNNVGVDVEEIRARIAQYREERRKSTED